MSGRFTDSLGADDRLAQDGPAARRSRDARYPQHRHLRVGLSGRSLEGTGRSRQSQARCAQPTVGSADRAVQPGAGSPAADRGEAPGREGREDGGRRHRGSRDVGAFQTSGRGIHRHGHAARRLVGSRELHGILRPLAVHGRARSGRRRPRLAGADRRAEVQMGCAAVQPGADRTPGHPGRDREPTEPDRIRDLRSAGALLPDEHQLQERARRAGGRGSCGAGGDVIGFVRIERRQRVRPAAERDSAPRPPSRRPSR